MAQIGIAFGGASAAESGGRTEELLSRLVDDRVASRIFEHDSTLWGPEAEAEASIRLGWTDFEPAARELIPQIESLRSELDAAGVDRIVLCGMGGSSLAPAVITRWAGVELTMIDTTHPVSMARVLAGDITRTAVVVSSKSGSTIETRSHLLVFERAFRDAGIDPASRIVIVTDPGSPLEAESRAAGRRVFNADPNVGGRFSALTAFGLVPSGLAGADIRRFVEEAGEARGPLSQDSSQNPALQLAAEIAAGLPERFVLAVWSAPSAMWGLGHWIEQLVAESTGKDGRGVLPIALSAAAPEFRLAPSSTLFVGVAGDEIADQLAGGDAPLSVAEGAVVAGTLGAQMVLWEVATAALGRLMDIDPFNQPDVEAAKIAARAALAEAAAAPEDDVATAAADGSARVLAAPAGESAETLLTGAGLNAALGRAVPEGGYLVVQAYLDPAGETAERLEELRDALASRLEVPVALGFGPSYLHSTGQLHKGGPALGAFLQITDRGADDVPIPDSPGFGVLIGAQARGDREVLMERGRPVISIELPYGDASLIEAAIEG